jgi:glutathione synthase/RimK-type ligase-like ATP-grasp enzyme
LTDVQGLLWHWVHNEPAALLIAQHVIWSAEAMGLKVFPSFQTCWHYDDKIAQKYLLEAIGAPIAPTSVFTNRRNALSWIDGASFPKVFKLRRGAGSSNVRLVRSRAEARRLVDRAFGRGFKPIPTGFGDAATKYVLAKRSHDVLGKIRRLPANLIRARQKNRLMGRERGYAYFQNFIPDNRYDIRITVIGNRAFGFTRNVRRQDFRASGSGSIDYDRNRISQRCIEVAFETAEKIMSQSVAFDFVMDEEGDPRIVEISYCYMDKPVYDCAGYWDRCMAFREGHLWPQDAILDDLLAQLTSED